MSNLNGNTNGMRIPHEEEAFNDFFKHDDYMENLKGGTMKTDIVRNLKNGNFTYNGKNSVLCAPEQDNDTYSKMDPSMCRDANGPVVAGKRNAAIMMQRMEAEKGTSPAGDNGAGGKDVSGNDLSGNFRSGNAGEKGQRRDGAILYLKKIKNVNISCKQNFLFFISNIFLSESINKMSVKEIIPLFEIVMVSIKDFVKYIKVFPPSMPAVHNFKSYCNVKTPYYKFEKLTCAATHSLLVLTYLPTDHEIFVLCKLLILICESAADKSETYKIIGTKLFKIVQEAIKKMLVLLRRGQQSEREETLSLLAHSGKEDEMCPNRVTGESDCTISSNLCRKDDTPFQSTTNASASENTSAHTNPGYFNELFLHLEVLLCILDQMCRNYKELKKLVTSYIEDNQSYNVNHMVPFIRYNIIHHKALDKMLCKISRYSNNLYSVSFCTELINYVVIKKKYLPADHVRKTIKKLIMINKMLCSDNQHVYIPPTKETILQNTKRELKQMFEGLQSLKKQTKEPQEESIKTRINLTEYIFPRKGGGEKTRKEKSADRACKGSESGKAKDEEIQSTNDQVNGKDTQKQSSSKKDAATPNTCHQQKEQVLKENNKQTMPISVTHQNSSNECPNESSITSPQSSNKSPNAGNSFFIANVKIHYDHNNVGERTMYLLERLSLENKTINTEKMIRKEIVSNDFNEEGDPANSESANPNGENTDSDNKEQYINHGLKNGSAVTINRSTIRTEDGNVSNLGDSTEQEQNEAQGKKHFSSSSLYSFESENSEMSDYSSTSSNSFSPSRQGEEEEEQQDEEQDEAEEKRNHYNDTSSSSSVVSSVSSASALSTLSASYLAMQSELQKDTSLKIPESQKNSLINDVPTVKESNLNEKPPKKYMQYYYVRDLLYEPVRCKFLPAPPVVKEERGLFIAYLFAEWNILYKNYLNILKMSIWNPMLEIIKQQHISKCVKYLVKLCTIGFLGMDHFTNQFLSHSLNISVSIAVQNLKKAAHDVKLSDTVNGGSPSNRDGQPVEGDMPRKTDAEEVIQTNERHLHKKESPQESLQKGEPTEINGRCNWIAPNEGEKEQGNENFMKAKTNDAELRETHKTSDLLNYSYVDAWCKMVITMSKLVEQEHLSPVIILQRALHVICRVIHKKCETEKKTFNQRPYFRLLHCLLVDINESCVHPNDIYIYMDCFANCFSLLSPLRVPSFCFSWLELISSKYFMPKMLAKICGWEAYKELLVALFTFMNFFLKKVKISKAIEALYIGTVRILLVLLHDFPDFLCCYYVTFCSLFPLNCIQLRNLVLSAFPRNVKLPDPFMSDVKIDLLQEIKLVPKILTNIIFPLFKKKLKNLIDEYFTNPDFTLLLHIKDKLFFSKRKTYHYSAKYDVDVLNSLIMYVGTSICRAKVNNMFKFNSNCDPVLLLKCEDSNGNVPDDQEELLQEIVLRDPVEKRKEKNIVSATKRNKAQKIQNKEQKIQNKEQKIQNKEQKMHNKEQKIHNKDQSEPNLSKKYVELMRDNNEGKNEEQEFSGSYDDENGENLVMGLMDDDADNDSDHRGDAILQRRKKRRNVIVVKNNLAYTLFLFLCKELDMEGRYLLLSNIVNHIRYPNSHTHYYSCLILFLFSQSNDVVIQEQIIRVLLERVLAHRPHPWGLLITFIELIKNAKFHFWECPFVHAASEIKKLFQSVAQACLGRA
ncbi:hypothetical protein C922_03681 [Plasmodium inui San Antonio 1]|uniref:CCR4-Not complex component Not1 C-terminal domain-containing protein n=1 Tax=Plasmodium inui San Antonio 1 TaxID=1237626 RepID=W7A9Y7_9APIC|nr:hypothetical protein C922_03681 [Plasmodium inui San Antonio 1]EUD65954.1 hypothetical protein C922_03681 [Plasmodium inui San Antonio 1]